jgi:ParB family transcriptional regulator, chromosome partitioning protein
MSIGTEKTHRPLGKGLSALLAPRSAPAPPQPLQPPATLPLDSIIPNPVQPRSVFQADRLEELAASIRANGIIQPLIVRRHADGYQIIAGERRWRAAKMAGLTEVPVMVQDVADPRMLELALIENIQREDLNPIELAHAYERLGSELGLSQDEIGERTGKNRTSIANIVRLLRLPKAVQILVAEHRLSKGHALAILGLPSSNDQVELAEKVVARGLSVRQAETMVKEATAERPRPGGSRREDPKDPNVKAAIDELERALGTRVRIVELTDQRGRIEIEYYSQADLDRLFQHFVGER